MTTVDFGCDPASCLARWFRSSPQRMLHCPHCSLTPSIFLQCVRASQTRQRFLPQRSKLSQLGAGGSRRDRCWIACVRLE